MTAETMPYFDTFIFDSMSNHELMMEIEDLVFTNSYAEAGSAKAKAYQHLLEVHLEQMQVRGFETVGDLINACLPY